MAEIQIPGVDFTALAREAIAHQVTKALVGSEAFVTTTIAEALARIDEQSRTAGEQFAVISTATQEQSSTATVLSRNLQSIAQANSEQRDVANELALTARELEGLAAQLRQEVDRFR